MKKMYKISSYIEYLENVFLIEKVSRYDVKGIKYIQIPQNIIYDELLIRGYSVDVGVVEVRNNRERNYYEIDFICNMASNRYYIQSALNIDSKEKNYQESRTLNSVHDDFKKIIVVKDDINHWYNEDGILIIGITEFLLNKNSMNL